jgi:predicted outer membrane lipoprotein
MSAGNRVSSIKSGTGVFLAALFCVVSALSLDLTHYGYLSQNPGYDCQFHLINRIIFGEY